MIRRRGLEPVVDTIANQKAYAAVIHYHLLRLRDGIGKLQTNVQATLGMSIRERTDKDVQFVTRMFEQAKAEADAVQASITAQYKAMVLAHQAQSAAAAPAEATISDAVRSSIWNVLHIEIFEDDQADERPERRGKLVLLFLREVWQHVLKSPIDELSDDATTAWRKFRQLVMTCTEDILYGIVRYAARAQGIRNRLAQALEASGAPYRFDGAQLIPAANQSG